MRLHVSKKHAAAAATAVLAAAATATAFAYWTGAGSGSGSATTAGSVSDVAVTQTAPVGNLAPGTSVPLSGLLTNPNATDIKVGTLTATITGVTGGAASSDFTITGNGVHVDAVVKKATPLAWSGMTLNYANSAVNQDNGKNATVTIGYTLAKFIEPPAGPSLGTITYANKALVVANVGLFPVSGNPSGMVVQPGDQLVVANVDWGGNHGDRSATTADASGVFNYASVGGFYVLDPQPLMLLRGTTHYQYFPTMMVG